jgi:opacity protein-like surface antigen
MRECPGSISCEGRLGMELRPKKFLTLRGGLVSTVLLACLVAMAGPVWAQRAPQERHHEHRASVYAGAHLGIASSRWSHSAVVAPIALPPGRTARFGVATGSDIVAGRSFGTSMAPGVFAGVTIPLRAGFFAGLEADLSVLQIKRSRSGSRVYASQSNDGCLLAPVPDDVLCLQSFFDLVVSEQHSMRLQQDGLATVRGRLGYSFGDTSVFVTAGVAATTVTSRLTSVSQVWFTPATDPGTGALTPGLGPAVSGSQTVSRTRVRLGVAYGAGIEHRLSETLSWRLEALRFDVGAQRVTFANGVASSVRLDGWLVRAGISRMF